MGEADAIKSSIRKGYIYQEDMFEKVSGAFIAFVECTDLTDKQEIEGCILLGVNHANVFFELSWQ